MCKNITWKENNDVSSMHISHRGFFWICHAVTVICYAFSSLVPRVHVGYFYVRDSASTNYCRHSINLILPTFSLFFMFAFISSIHCFFISSSSFLLMDCTRQVRWTHDINWCWRKIYTFFWQMIWLLRNVLKTMDHLLAGHVLQLLLADVALPHPSLQSFVLGLQLPAQNLCHCHCHCNCDCLCHCLCLCYCPRLFVVIISRASLIIFILLNSPDQLFSGVLVHNGFRLDLLCTVRCWGF